MNSNHRIHAISGSWRNYNNEVEQDVRTVVLDIMKKGDMIVTGGALGVDYIATDTVLKYGNPETQLIIHLPILYYDFCAHYIRRAEEGVITMDQANMIVNQLEAVYKASPNSIKDKTPYNQANMESYYARNTQIIHTCHVLHAFQVNDSQGTQDAIDKAIEMGKEVFVRKYLI